MAQKQKTSKTGRNKAKCERYRTRHGRTVGSKKPKKPGSNPQQRSYAPPRPSNGILQVTGHQTDVPFQMTASRSTLLTVPREWVK